MRQFKYCPYCRSVLNTKYIDGKKRRFCPQCGWVNYVNPLPVVACLVENKQGEILLVRRDVAPAKGKWALPGGFMEIKESPHKACLRELKEETSIRQAKIIKLLGAYTRTSKLYGTTLTLGFFIKTNQEKVYPGDDVCAAKFVSLKNIPRLPFSTQQKVLADYLKLLSS